MNCFISFHLFSSTTLIVALELQYVHCSLVKGEFMTTFMTYRITQVK